MKWLLDNGPTLVISVISLGISVRAWYKSRVFYGIEVFELHHSDHFGLMNKELQNKLSTGKYTILNTYQDEDIVFPNNLIDWADFQKNGLKNIEKKEKVFVLLGKIKK